MRLILLAPALLAFAAPLTAAPAFPAMTGEPVVDAANVIGAADEQRLDQHLRAIATKTGHQVVVAIVPSLGGLSIEDYGYQLGRTWAIGHKGQNDGTILLVAPAERKVRIEVGYGLEPVLTDALTSTILRTDVKPLLAKGDVAGALDAGIDRIADAINPMAGGSSATVRPRQAHPTATLAENALYGLIVIVIGGLLWAAWFWWADRGNKRDDDKYRASLLRKRQTYEAARRAAFEQAARARAAEPVPAVPYRTRYFSAKRRTADGFNGRRGSSPQPSAATGRAGSERTASRQASYADSEPTIGSSATASSFAESSSTSYGSDSSSSSSFGGDGGSFGGGGASDSY